MRNKSAGKFMNIISKLLKEEPDVLISDNLLSCIDSALIRNYRCATATQINGYKWVAPLYRPTLKGFKFKAKTFIAVRFNTKSVDIEYVEPSGESVTFTASEQEWREKEGYFLALPPERLKGRMEDTVNALLRYKKNGIEPNTTNFRRKKRTHGGRRIKAA